MLLQIRVSVSLLLLMLIAQCLSNAHPQQGLKIAIGRWNFASNGKVFMDRRCEAAVTTGKELKIRKLVLAEKEKENSGDGEGEGKGKGKGKGEELSVHHRRKEIPGFVAFTADYKPPKHHPPKNN